MAAPLILELSELGKEGRDGPKRGGTFGLTADELASYDAPVDDGDVREVVGNDAITASAHYHPTACRH